MQQSELIINRIKPCNCGCGGSDPWHQSTYHRIVTRWSDTEGTVKMPYSTKPVRVTREAFTVGDRVVYGGWCVDRDSIVFDRS